MDWYPFNLGEGQALSLEIDIGDPDVEVPVVRIAVYDGDGEPIVDDGAVTAEALAEAPLDAIAADATFDAMFDSGGASPIAAMVAEDQIWIGSDQVVAASDIVSAEDGGEESPAPWLFGDTLVIAESAAEAEAVEHALAPEPTDSLTMSDVFGAAEDDVPRVLGTPAGNTPATTAGTVDHSHGVVVVLGHEGSEELYYIDYII